MSAVVYLDTSAVLRAVLERGMSPDVEAAIGGARYLITSRLSLVESSRAMLRLRSAGGATELLIADATRDLESMWARCTIWELTPAVCDLAQMVAPDLSLRTLDALHLATWLLARRRIGGDVSLVTTDARLTHASRSVQ